MFKIGYRSDKISLLVVDIVFRLKVVQFIWKGRLEMKGQDCSCPVRRRREN